MANYSLVANSQFKARSFDDLIRPYLMYTQEYRAQEDALADLATKADVWQGLANEQTDPIAYAQYTNYANSLKDQAQILADRGLNPSSRQTLLNLKRRYASEIAPIEQAYAARKAQIEEQRKALLQNPTILFSRRADTTSLDDYIKNPTLGYESYSGALLTQQMSEMAKTLADELMRPGDNQTKRELIQVLPYQYVERIKRGLTRQEINEFINDPAVNPILQGMANQVLASSGIESWNAPDALKAAKHFINQGAWAAEGTETTEKWTDSYGQQSALQRQQYDLMDRNARNAEIREAERKAAQAKESELEAIANRGESFLVSSGKYNELLNTLNKFKVGNNGMNADYVGKHGEVNPMKVYEEYRKELKNNDRINEKVAIFAEAQARAVGSQINLPGVREGLQRRIDAYEKKLRSGADAADLKNSIMKKYGVTKMITDSDYKELSSLGYTGELKKGQKSRTNFIDTFNDLINDKVQSKMIYSTAMSDYSYPGELISTTLGFWDNNGSFAGNVYRLNTDGSKGKPIEEYDDLDIVDDNGKSKISDILYSAEYPTSIIVQIGRNKDAKRYIMKPEVLGNNVAKFLYTYGQQLSQDTDKTKGSITITAGLSNFLNSYNPTASRTAKDE